MVARGYYTPKILPLVLWDWSPARIISGMTFHNPQHASRYLPNRLSATVFAALIGLATASAQNPVTDWNNIAINAAVAANQTTSPGSFNQPSSMMYLAYVHLAVFDGVNSIDHQYHSYGPDITATSTASKEAATIEAAYRMCLYLFPDQAATLATQYNTSMAAISDGTAKSDGMQAGLAAANSIIALRTGDGRLATVPYTWPSIPTAGVWTPTPPAFASPILTWFGDMIPFTMSTSSQFRPGPPPKLYSEKWAKAYKKTKDFGALNSTVRTPQQTEVALFWTDHAGKQFGRAFRALAVARNLDVSESARLFAILYAAGADGAIGCFDAKYHYSFWRPITAIQNGDIDGNPNTLKDASWAALVATPAFPEYPSAHSCLAGAFAGALRNFFGTSKVTLVVTSAVTNTTHTFTDTQDIVTEMARARIDAGFHYRFSVNEGAELGSDVARQISKKYFRRMHGDGRDDHDDDDHE